MLPDTPSGFGTFRIRVFSRFAKFSHDKRCGHATIVILVIISSRQLILNEIFNETVYKICRIVLVGILARATSESGTFHW
jgi:hypothetical protein